MMKLWIPGDSLLVKTNLWYFCFPVSLFMSWNMFWPISNLLICGIALCYGEFTTTFRINVLRQLVRASNVLHPASNLFPCLWKTPLRFLRQICLIFRCCIMLWGNELYWNSLTITSFCVYDTWSQTVSSISLSDKLQGCWLWFEFIPVSLSERPDSCHYSLSKCGGRGQFNLHSIVIGHAWQGFKIWKLCFVSSDGWR